MTTKTNHQPDAGKGQERIADLAYRAAEKIYQDCGAITEATFRFPDENENVKLGFAYGVDGREDRLVLDIFNRRSHNSYHLTPDEIIVVGRIPLVSELEEVVETLEKIAALLAESQAQASYLPQLEERLQRLALSS